MSAQKSTTTGTLDGPLDHVADEALRVASMI